jgi:hypothetical protein
MCNRTKDPQRNGRADKLPSFPSDGAIGLCFKQFFSSQNSFFMSNYILRSFNQRRDGDLVTIAHRVAMSLKSNTAFPNPPKPVAELEQALLDYQVALSNAAGRDKTLVSIKNDKRAALRALLAELADYVTSICNGDRTMLLSSGFDLARQRGETPLQPITSLDVEIGPPGQAITRTKSVVGARTYVHEYTKDPLMGENSWVTRITTERQFTFTDLTSGVKHWFRVKAIGFGGQTVHSPVVARYIQ